MPPSIKILSKSAQFWGIKLPTGSVEGAIKALQEFFVEKFGEGVLWDCEACGNRVPDYDVNGLVVDVCPYCGMQFEFDGEQSDETNENDTELESLEGREQEQTEDDSDDDDDDDDLEEEPEDEDEPEEDEDCEEPVPEPVKKRGRPKKSDTEKKISKAKTERKKKEKAPKVTKAKRVKVPIPISNKPPADESEFEYKGVLANTTEELKKTVQRIISLRNNIAINAYDIGTELNHINQHELWKNSEHKSFYDFCLNELEFSRASAYKYMLCAREFDRDTFLQIGVKKGELIASVGPTMRPKLLREAASGATHNDLMDTIKRLKGRPSEDTEIKNVLEVPKVKAEKPEGESAPNWQGRIKLGEFGIPWFAEGTKNPIKQANVRSRYAVIPITETIELYLVPNKDETGLIACYRKTR